MAHLGDVQFFTFSNNVVKNILVSWCHVQKFLDIYQGFTYIKDIHQRGDQHVLYLPGTLTDWQKCQVLTMASLGKDVNQPNTVKVLLVA